MTQHPALHCACWAKPEVHSWSRDDRSWGAESLRFACSGVRLVGRHVGRAVLAGRCADAVQCWTHPVGGTGFVDCRLQGAEAQPHTSVLLNRCQVEQPFPSAQQVAMLLLYHCKLRCRWPHLKPDN